MVSTKPCGQKAIFSHLTTYRYNILVHWVGIKPTTRDSQSWTQTTQPGAPDDVFKVIMCKCCFTKIRYFSTLLLCCWSVTVLIFSCICSTNATLFWYTLLVSAHRRYVPSLQRLCGRRFISVKLRSWDMEAMRHLVSRRAWQVSFPMVCLMVSTVGDSHRLRAISDTFSSVTWANSKVRSKDLSCTWT